MNYLIEIFTALILTVYFVHKENPKIKYLFYGYFFFLITLLMQIPFRITEIFLKEHMPQESRIPFIIVSFGIIIVTEISKYYSLKSFVNTKSVKNGVLFGIGWATIESIQYFSIIFFSFIFSVFSLNFDYALLLKEQNPLVNFFFFFVFNLSITVLVIFAVIKNKLLYLIQAILYSCLVLYSIRYIGGTLGLLLQLIFVLYSLFIIFKYKKLH